MAGTVILTGANGSLGLHAVENLLRKYPQHTAILTVRDASEADVNTRRLRDIVSRYPEAKTSIHQLDLANLTAVHEFADSVILGVTDSEYPPLVSIICSAYNWNLVDDPELTVDGYDMTFQINYIAHVALVLRLIGQFGDDGRVVLISSDSHWPGKNPMEKYPPTIPDELELLVRPASYDDKYGRGYQRYATSKLALTTWMLALNHHLTKDPSLSKVAAFAMDPGNMVDSRALTRNTPQRLARLQKFAYVPLLPLFRLANPTLRTAAPASVDVVELSLGPEYKGKGGYYTRLQRQESSPESRDESRQHRLWTKTLEWARVTKDNTALQAAFD